MMNRILVPLSLAVLVLSAAPSEAQGITRLTKANAKVTVPVVVEIIPQPDPGPGLRRVRIVVRPSVDAAQMTIDVAAESGLALTGPAASWTLPARAGEEVVRELDLAVSGPGELRIVVTTTVKYGDDFTQTGIEVFAFDPADSALPKGLMAGPPAPTDPGGRLIIEIPARIP